MDFCFKRSYRGPLKAVILDWAGTTVDFGCMAPVVVFREVFRRFGVEISMEQARGPMGTYKRAHIAQIAEMEPVRQKWQEVHGRPPCEDDIEQMFQAFIPAQMKVLADYADPVPGCLEAMKVFREQGLKIGSTTGYTREMMDLLQAESGKRGYVPDAVVSATDVPAGRPAPWMCFMNAMRLGIYPMESMVKIGDTLADIEEGLNAGMWTIGVVMTGNEIGVALEEFENMDPDLKASRRRRAYSRMLQAGAHYVVDSIAEVPPLLEEISKRLAFGEKP